MKNKKITSSQSVSLLEKLKDRFERNNQINKKIKWSDVSRKLELNTSKLYSLFIMEETGGEPNLLWIDNKKDEYIFVDSSTESPSGRRSFCYDRDALNSRKENKPKNSAVDFANEIGAEILSEEEYRELQKSGKYDNKTSSWLKTPEKIRKLGGAIFGDYRYDNIFIYHNGAESYYASRGVRVKLKV